MIKYLLIAFLSFTTLYSSMILSYNIYDRTDRVDVMITFDTPYEGVIKQSVSKSKIIIKLQDAKIESSKLKQLSSKYLNSLSITPMSGYTQIVASIPSSTILKASKTSDAYGLRLRFTDRATTNKTQTVQKTSNNSLLSLATKKDGNISQSYYIVIAILIIGIVILFYLRKKVIPKQSSTKANAWLFKDASKGASVPETPVTPPLNAQNVSIRFQKPIDNENSVVMLDFGEQSYLVLMGKSNILLDKFNDNKPQNQEDFESILQSRHQELDDFLRVQEKPKEPLQSYKERAASIIYEEA